MENNIKIANRVKVIGVGGGGGNAVNHMIDEGFPGVSFIVVNSDAQDLNRSLAEVKIQLGPNLAKGLGSGGKPELGCGAARESIAQIQEAIDKTDLVFIVAGMGGGTGTGAAPVIAKAVKEMGAIVVGAVTMPVLFEDSRRMSIAEAGVVEMRNHADSMIILPTDKLMRLMPKNATLTQAFKIADEVLFRAIRCISDLITLRSLINLDYADVQKFMRDPGFTMIGENRAAGLVDKFLSPLDAGDNQGEDNCIFGEDEMDAPCFYRSTPYVPTRTVPKKAKKPKKPCVILYFPAKQDK